MASIIGVETLQHTNGTTAATIDSSGRILKTQQIAFLAYKSTNGSVTYSADDSVSADMNTTDFNYGNHYKTSGSNAGKFVAPIAGLYFMGMNLWHNTTTAKRVALIRSGDGVAFAGQGGSPEWGNDITNSSVVYLAANETVHIKAIYDSTLIYQGDNHSYFYGYFIG